MLIDDHSVYIRPNFKPKKDYAVFLDRDGVINQEKHLVHRLSDFAILPKTPQAIKKLNQKNIPVIVIHNAAVVARNLCSTRQVEKLNSLMVKKLLIKDAFVDAIFYCPHHHDAYNPKVVKDCQWRKPRSGMLTSAAKIFKLNLGKSYVIGDTSRDILAAKTVKATALQVKSTQTKKSNTYQAIPDKTFNNTLDAVNYILTL